MAAKAGGINGIRQICEKACRELDYDLFDVSIDKEPTGKYLRIYIDTERENGITLDDCEKYHHAVQPLVEDYDYDFMEVCSPGADRPVRDEKDAERYRGELVDIKLYKAMNGCKELCAELCAMDKQTVTVLLGGEETVLDRKLVSTIRLHPDLSALDEEQ